MATMTMNSEPLYTIKEAAALGYGADSTIRMYIRQGKLSAEKIGGRVKLRREDLDAMRRPHPSTVRSGAAQEVGGR